MSKKKKLPIHVVPEAWSVLYVHPMKGEFAEQGRKCSNCFMWVSGNSTCVIHEDDVTIPGSAVCGYHVPGEPMETANEFQRHESIQRVDPEASGLESDIPEEGTMCGNCKFYTPTEKDKMKGYCGVVTKDNSDTPLYKARVEFYGCCTRWED